MTGFELPKSVGDQRTRHFFDYWRSKTPASGLSGRQHVDPLEMKAFLPGVILIDVERQAAGLRFRVRLMGSHIVDMMGDDVTGRYLDESSPARHYPRVHARLTSIVETKQPAYGISPVPRETRDFMQYEHLTVPLAADGTTVDMLMGVRFGLVGAGNARS